MTNSGILRARFGERVKTLLRDAGLTSADLAARSDLPVSRIERILHGRLIPLTLRDMSIIAGVLGTPLWGLLAPSDVATAVIAIQIIK